MRLIYYHEIFHRINFVKLFNFFIFSKYLMNIPGTSVRYHFFFFLMRAV